MCEYCTNAVYPKAEKVKHIKEYDRNEEGSYLLETAYGRRMVFDATRMFQQVSRIGLTMYCVYVTCILFLFKVWAVYQPHWVKAQLQILLSPLHPWEVEDRALCHTRDQEG